MLLISCPNCGARDEGEFRYGGPVQAARPDPLTTSDEEWVDYLTHAPNPLGPVQEYWWHVAGCGRWLSLWRDTRTHDITEPPHGY